MYKIMFFDLDGTLLNDEKEILEENKIAIKKAQENGIEVALCSGRQKLFIEKYRNSAQIGRYAISTNGSAIYDLDSNEEIFSCGIDKEIVRKLCDLAEAQEILIKLDTKYARYINDSQYLWLNCLELDKDYDKFIEENTILQVSLGTKTEKEIDEIIESLKDESFIKIEIKYKIPNGENSLWIINIINKSVSKGNAISGLCKYLKIDLKDVIAFGDDLNDLSMLQNVGMGVAMGNALPKVKEVAKIVIGDNNKPSIADFINRIIEENK